MNYTTTVLALVNWEIYKLNKKKEAIEEELKELEDMRKELEINIYDKEM